MEVLKNVMNEDLKMLCKLKDILFLISFIQSFFYFTPLDT